MRSGVVVQLGHGETFDAQSAQEKGGIFGRCIWTRLRAHAHEPKFGTCCSEKSFRLPLFWQLSPKMNRRWNERHALVFLLTCGFGNGQLCFRCKFFGVGE